MNARLVRSALVAIVGVVAALAPHAVGAVSTSVVISQVYPEGGRGGFINDYVELHNRGSSTVDMDGWSLQYQNASVTAGAYSVTTLTNVTIGPGAYFLIREGTEQQFPYGDPLPAPDATGTINLELDAGKLALRTTTAACLAGSCVADGGTLDFVGYGGANEHEGSGSAPDPAEGLDEADSRLAAGEQDTDENGSDFTKETPSPRNSASPAIDNVGPAAALKSIGAFQGSASFGVGWSATDISGVAAYVVRARHASPQAAFTGYSPWYTGTSTTGAYSSADGQTVCVSVQAQDTVGNWGAFSAERCTAIPIDDGSLGAFKFARKTNAGYFDGTYSMAVATGAKLTSKTITAKRLALLATTCAVCGSVQVKWKGAVVATLSLYSATTKHKVVIPVAVLPAVQAGLAQIVTLSAARVEVDGLGASRT